MWLRLLSIDGKIVEIVLSYYINSCNWKLIMLNGKLFRGKFWKFKVALNKGRGQKRRKRNCWEWTLPLWLHLRTRLGHGNEGCFAFYAPQFFAFSHITVIYVVNHILFVDSFSHDWESFFFKKKNQWCLRIIYWNEVTDFGWY